MSQQLCRLSSAMPSPNYPNNSYPTTIHRSSSEPSLALVLPLSNNKRVRKKGGTTRPPSKSHKQKSNSSDLTEEKLKEFDRRNAAKAVNAANDKKNKNCSPYYKGLTDSSLYITRQRLSCSSPGRESVSTTITTSSKSTVFTKIQEWGISCFRGKSNIMEDESYVIKQVDLLDPIETKKVVLEENLRLNPIETKIVVLEEKPLRERVPETDKPSVFVAKRKPVVEEKLKEVMVNKEKGSEYVWADKYRPNALKEFICNRDKAEQVLALVKSGECSHYIFEGRPGVGKRTMVWALLREAFGAEKSKTKEEIMDFELKGEAIPSISVKVTVSSQHIEINLSELRGYEKNVIIELIKKRHKIGVNDKLECDHTNCHAIVLYDADILSTDAQLYIRWLMERTKGCNKIFFCCHDVSKLQHIRSLCKVVQLLPPSNEEIVEVLEFIAEQEGLQLPDQLAQRIAENSKHNLRQAIRSFEASWRLNYPFKEDQVIMTGWEEDIANIAKNIIEEQSPKQLYIIRGKLQSLIDHNVSPEFIFSTLKEELKRLLDYELQSKVDALYQDYNRDVGCMFKKEKPTVLLQSRNEETRGSRKHDLRKNVQQFMRIEEFTAKFMSLYKSSLMTENEQANGGLVEIPNKFGFSLLGTMNC